VFVAHGSQAAVHFRDLPRERELKVSMRRERESTCSGAREKASDGRFPARRRGSGSLAEHDFRLRATHSLHLPAAPSDSTAASLR
jgi:hypothetical protein